MAAWACRVGRLAEVRPWHCHSAVNTGGAPFARVSDCSKDLWVALSTAASGDRSAAVGVHQGAGGAEGSRLSPTTAVLVATPEAAALAVPPPLAQAEAVTENTIKWGRMRHRGDLAAKCS